MKLTKIEKVNDFFNQPLDIISDAMFTNGTKEHNVGLYDYGAGKYVFFYDCDAWMFETDLRGDKLYNEFESKIIRLYKELKDWHEVFLVVMV